MPSTEITLRRSRNADAEIAQRARSTRRTSGPGAESADQEIKNSESIARTRRSFLSGRRKMTKVRKDAPNTI